jgi:predicted nucleic acid-binding protein
MKHGANPAVRAWLDNQVAETLFLTAVNLSELLLGIQILPQGKRKKALSAALGDQIRNLFGSRILPFDQQAAVAYAELIARSRESGHAISVVDGQIAAIARANGFIVATRDVGPFKAAGLEVINPWEAST